MPGCRCAPRRGRCHCWSWARPCCWGRVPTPCCAACPDCPRCCLCCWCWQYWPICPRCGPVPWWPTTSSGTKTCRSTGWTPLLRLTAATGGTGCWSCRAPTLPPTDGATPWIRSPPVSPTARGWPGNCSSTDRRSQPTSSTPLTGACTRTPLTPRPWPRWPGSWESTNSWCDLTCNTSATASPVPVCCGICWVGPTVWAR